METTMLREQEASARAPFVKRILYQDENIVTFTLSFKPGQSLIPHRHGDSSVVLLVQAGSGEATVDEQTVALRVGEVLSVRGDETLSAVNTGQENLLLYVNMAPRPADPRYVAEIG